MGNVEVLKKRCNGCKEVLELFLFSNHKKGKHGKDSTCKKCKNYRRKITMRTDPVAKTKRADRNKIWRGVNKEYVKSKYKEWKSKNYTHMLDYYKEYNKNRTPEQRLLQRGNIIKHYWPGVNAVQALENYSELLKRQNDCCAICRRHRSEFTNSLAIDHSHKTGKVRGALCYRCNRLYVSIHTVETALAVYEYLLKHDG